MEVLSVATFGKMLKDARLVRGLSRDSLAARSGVTASYIWRLESGRQRRPSQRVADVIDEIFRVG